MRGRWLDPQMCFKVDVTFNSKIRGFTLYSKSEIFTSIQYQRNQRYLKNVGANDRMYTYFLRPRFNYILVLDSL